MKGVRARPAQITLVILLVVSSVAVVGVSTDPSEPVIQVEPKISTGAPGETFTVNITISDVTLENGINGVYLWQFGMSFNPDVLKVTSTMEGPWLRSGGDTYSFSKIDNDEGIVAHMSILPWETDTGVFGSGTLANVTFQVLAVGNCFLRFNRTRTYIQSFNGTGQPPPKIPHTVLDGFFSNVHDVAITSVTPLATQVNVSDPVDIDVIVANEGDFNETFDVTTYWNIGSSEWSGVINETKTGIYLKNGTNTSPPLTFTWDTTGFKAGNYTISAEASAVTGETNLTNNQYVDGQVTVNVPGAPVATFTYSPKIPSVNETVTFNSTSFDLDGTVVGWKWDFDGDGNLDAFDENATHIYTAAGTYTAILFVTDDEGNEAFSYESIKVVAPPVANFTYSPKEVLVRQPVDFTSTSYDADGNIESLKWDLDGDGTFDAFSENVTYTYTEARTYTVNLTVTDDDDLSDSISENVTVKTKHDVAVESVSCPGAWAGQYVDVSFLIVNEGTYNETFDVIAYYDNTTIGMKEVADLPPADQAPYNTRTISMIWPTGVLPEGGYYNVTVEAALYGDQDLTNNKNSTTVYINKGDVAITNVEASPTVALAGSLLNVTVVVKNEGTGPANPLITIELTNATGPMEMDSKSNIFVENATEKSVLFRDWNASAHGFSPGNYTLSAKLKPVPYEFDLADNNFTYGEITLGASLVSISATPESITLGSSTTINGSITPLRRNVNATIHHRVSGNDTWSILEIVITNDNGTYSYDWKPEATGTYEVMVGWEGDNKALSSKSETLTIIVNPAAPILLYALAAVAVAVIIIVVAIYFLKIRKPKSA